MVSGCICRKAESARLIDLMGRLDKAAYAVRRRRSASVFKDLT